MRRKKGKRKENRVHLVTTPVQGLAKWLLFRMGSMTYLTSSRAMFIHSVDPTQASTLMPCAPMINSYPQLPFRTKMNQP